MEKFEHIDQIIREKFENFEPEPPSKVWENVRSNISQTPPPSPHGLMLPIIFIATFLLFVGSLVLNLLTKDDNSGLNSNSPESYLKTAGLISTGSTTKPGQTLEEAIYQTYQDNHLEQVLTNSGKPASKAATDGDIKVKAPFHPVNQTTNRAITREKQRTASNIPISDRGQWKPGLRQAIEAGEIGVADAVNYNLSLRDLRKISGFQYYKRNDHPTITVGLYFNPEVTTYQSESLENTVSYGVGILPQVNFRHFFLQSGLNARFTHDKGNSSITYNQFLGTYNDVYLVTFDSTENGVIPTYHTQVKEVYDTLDHYAITETKADYTYLEVPVLFGYRFETGRLSIFAKGGPLAAFLVSKRMPDQNLEEKARIVNVDYQVPARSQVNWQLMIGAGIDYRFTENVSFSIEPTFRYSLNPEYKLPDDANAKSHTFGIRVGLNYKF